MHQSLEAMECSTEVIKCINILIYIKIILFLKSELLLLKIYNQSIVPIHLTDYRFNSQFANYP